MQFGKLALKHCRYGWMLYHGTYIGTCFDLYGEYSESEVAMMRQFLRPGATVIDIGANIGSLTIPMSQMVGASGRVYAVESFPFNFNVLCANLALNGIENTKPIFAYISDEREGSDASHAEAPFYVSETWPATRLSLDSLALDACHFIKIDVDGAELQVLRGAEMLIERFRPVLYFENDLRDRSPALLSFAMENLGYKLYFHPAPIADMNNFFGNTQNPWAPTRVVSSMMLGIPRERDLKVELQPVVSPDDWWEFLK